MMVVGAGDGSTSVLKVGYLAAILILFIIYLPRILCLSSCLSSCHIPVIFLSSCHSCGTLSYSLCLSNQTDQGDEREGFEREEIEMERQEMYRLKREGVKRLFLV